MKNAKLISAIVGAALLVLGALKTYLDSQPAPPAQKPTIAADAGV